MALTFNVALELYGAKQNLQFQLGPPRPSLEQIIGTVEAVFTSEAKALRPQHAVLQGIIVDDLELYDESTRQWSRFDHPMQLQDGCQLYAFQPNSTDDQGRIPQARPA
eukprot:Hpha_TRINITY_DN21454_c0_g1::TRINITY_DN21454_c0_g1_i1::g.148199::m.148199